MIGEIILWAVMSFMVGTLFGVIVAVIFNK